ncbi:methylated-DNA--[protein]-cysteine S-methyltransferase [Wenzhouxiangella sp. XN24]|uniref:methylated-DNA--[protein]-cysteine S-methyltransferase n=1 Tax=Wenzhouxiangella sp. XN24 TaxID=2713569 RepID=UPI0013EB8D8E|nr:methylated-DNA--[protein]-cysteine S-methyltransferase [Wenzhouxiangella sp. XN24]NGX15436.1 methylated-DNA--[protein]-cysteine S-methyltransferase [Wenzhouxiangella sp. XN24]
MIHPAEPHDFSSQRAFDRALARGIAELPPARPDASVLYLARFETPLGSLLAGANGVGLVVLEFTDPERLDAQLHRLARRLKYALRPGATAASEQAGRELEAYFAHGLRQFTVPLAPIGTPFQHDAWRRLRSIPYGQTVSYGEQARRIGRPRAVRAVAQANGANPITIVVPCHRVIGSDGTLTGYGGGIWRKRWLLAHESAVPTASI